VDSEELPQHLVFAALAPAARLALSLDVSLKDLKKLVELAAFREARRMRFKMREIRDRFGVSMAKVGVLSRELKDRFSSADAEQGLSRRILSVLWATPLSEVGVQRALKDVPQHEVSSRLAELLAEGSIVEVAGRTPRYTLAESRYRLVKERWMAKLDALATLMNTVGDVAVARLLKGDARALARNLEFHVRLDQLETLGQFYEEQLLPLVQSLEDAAQEAPDGSVPMQLAFVYSPRSEPD